MINRGFSTSNRDPDEMVNMLGNSGYRDTARELAIKLKEYGVKYQDPRMDDPRIKADLDWLMNGKGAYLRTQGEFSRQKKERLTRGLISVG